MKKQTRNLIAIIAVLGLIFSGYLMISPLINPPNVTSCDYNSPTKNYIGKSDEECKVIKFLCTIDRKPFQDKCGCGCEKINLELEKVYCTPEQKTAEVCPEYYSATCGWFNGSIKCLKYPCANTFSNPCFACADENVEYYTSGECPK